VKRHIIPQSPLVEFAHPVRREVAIDPLGTYRTVGCHLYGEGVYERETKTGVEIKASRMWAIDEDDLVINRIWAQKGSAGIVPNHLAGAVVTQDFPVWVLDSNKAFPPYIGWYLKTPSFWEECRRHSHGTSGRERLSPKELPNVMFPFPPLDEQRRIVARIEELAALIEEAHGLRAKARAEARLLSSSTKNDVFNEEFRGKWRAVTLGQVADIRSGVTLGRKLSGPTIQLPYLRVANVQDGYLDLHEVKVVEIRASERDKWLLQPGDILLTEGGDWDKLGRGTVWHGEISNCIHQNHIFRVRVSSNEFIPEYLSALISSPYGKTYFQSASKQTTNLATINQTQLKAFSVFRPPLPEQHRIVTYLDDLQAQVDELTALQDATQAELDALLPSVLDRAFRGEL
jgi:type I restriction enzyme S subunit